MREHLIVKHMALSPANGLNAYRHAVAHRKDGRTQTVERPEWYNWLLLFGYAWVVWSLVFTLSDISANAAVIAVSIFYVGVFSFNIWLWTTGRLLVRVVSTWERYKP